MAYSRLYKVCQNFALGIQSVNTAIGNMEDFFSAWTAKHGKQEATVGAVPVPLNPYETFGHHNDPAVPRAITLVTPVTFGPGGSGCTFSTQGPIKGVVRLGVGLYSISMDGRLDVFWGVALPMNGAAADIRYCKPTSYFPTSPGVPPSVLVSCYSSTGGAASVLTDFTFTCAIYGYVTPATVATASDPLRLGRFSRLRPPWLRFKGKR